MEGKAQKRREKSVFSDRRAAILSSKTDAGGSKLVFLRRRRMISFYFILYLVLSYFWDLLIRKNDW